MDSGDMAQCSGTAPVHAPVPPAHSFRPPWQNAGTLCQVKSLFHEAEAFGQWRWTREGIGEGVALGVSASDRWSGCASVLCEAVLTGQHLRLKHAAAVGFEAMIFGGF